MAVWRSRESWLVYTPRLPMRWAADSSPLDGVHLDATNTRAIGEALAPIVRVMLEL